MPRHRGSSAYRERLRLVRREHGQVLLLLDLATRNLVDRVRRPPHLLLDGLAEDAADELAQVVDGLRREFGPSVGPERLLPDEKALDDTRCDLGNLLGAESRDHVLSQEPDLGARSALRRVVPVAPVDEVLERRCLADLPRHECAHGRCGILQLESAAFRIAKRLVLLGVESHLVLLPVGSLVLSDEGAVGVPAIGGSHAALLQMRRAPGTGALREDCLFAATPRVCRASGLRRAGSGAVLLSASRAVFPSPRACRPTTRCT
jgi:hypothetical protein